MFARIRHLASHTERYDTMAKFYGTIFGMKQITTGLMDENSKANAERGHISDGVIGMALLAKRAGSGQGLDHFGFEVEDVREAVDRIDRFYPSSCTPKPWPTCPSPASAPRTPSAFSSISRKRPGQRPRRLPERRLGAAALAQSHRAARPRAGKSRRVLP